MDKINIQALMRERDRLFKRYCNENNPTLKVSKHSKYKNARKKKKISKKEHFIYNTIENTIIFKSIQKMLKKIWDRINQL